MIESSQLYFQAQCNKIIITFDLKIFCLKNNMQSDYFRLLKLSSSVEFDLAIQKIKKSTWCNVRGRLRDFRSKLFRQEIWPMMHFHDIIERCP